jgi:hypothetical protein
MAMLAALVTLVLRGVVAVEGLVLVEKVYWWLCLVQAVAAVAAVVAAVSVVGE